MKRYSHLIEYATSIGCEYKQNEPMSCHTTFRVGGNCDVMLMPDTREKLIDVRRFCMENELTYYILGNGSNVVFDDAGFDGVVILTTMFNECRLIDENHIYCDAGVKLSSMCLLALNSSLTGAEKLYGIPGTVGGAICMNAGAYGGETKMILKTCDYLDDKNQLVTSDADSLGLGYRHSVFSDNDYVVLGAVFELTNGNKDEIKAEMDELMQRRRDKQPLEYPSAGSVFKRPEGHFAGALIQQCGFKGNGVGGAVVSEKHAGFIVNKGGATCEDIIELVRKIQASVFETSGVTLECEIKFVVNNR